MAAPAIRVDGMTKLYHLGRPPERYRTLRDTVARWTTAPARLLRRDEGDPRARELWALRDVSFEVKRGEVIGIIGRNGAGKSTLLKILSRITEPTRGEAVIRGRVSSLLEVGTGFHHELTGRENIYLNGAILGMKRADITRKFDEMVAFAEVERFLDTPVKHYSSGMYLRLAFAVAAHLEPEIMLVDEVLAVGDLAFQRKCLGKMESVASEGRTVLFVSHNLGAVKSLCHSSLVLDGGVVAFRGPVLHGIAVYSALLLRPGTEEAGRGARWVSLTLGGRHPDEPAAIAPGEAPALEGVLDLHQPLRTVRLFCIIEDMLGNLVVHHRLDLDGRHGPPLLPGRHRARIELPTLWLAPGAYTTRLKILAQGDGGEDVRHVSDRMLLEVTGDVQGLGKALLAPSVRWHIAPEAARGAIA